MTDKIEKGDIEVEYFPTAEMIANFMSKILQVHIFLGKLIMGYLVSPRYMWQQECVERLPTQ